MQLRSGSRVQRIGAHDADDLKDPAPAVAETPAYIIIKQKHCRWWEVRDPDDEPVCLTVYRKGAREVVRRLAA